MEYSYSDAAAAAVLYAQYYFGPRQKQLCDKKIPSLMYTCVYVWGEKVRRVLLPLYVKNNAAHRATF